MNGGACAVRWGRERGISLVELVVVMTILGIVASIAATLVGSVASTQQDTRTRLTLAMAADSALSRLADDLASALPNSVRVSNDGSGNTWIEYVPVLDGGRYRAAPDTTASGPGNILDVTNAASNVFDVIGTPIATPLDSGAQLVIQNLGTPEADAYAGTSRRSGVVVSNGGATVSFTAGAALPQSTSTQHFYIVGTPVTVACTAAGGGGYSLTRYSGYAWQAAQPAGLGNAVLAGATASLMLAALNNCGASYALADAALANIGLLRLSLSFGAFGANASGGAMNLVEELPVNNTP